MDKGNFFAKCMCFVTVVFYFWIRDIISFETIQTGEHRQRETVETKKLGMCGNFLIVFGMQIVRYNFPMVPLSAMRKLNLKACRQILKTHSNSFWRYVFETV